MSKKHRLAKHKEKHGPQAAEDTSPQVYQESKINWDLAIRERKDFTAKQKTLIELLLDKKTKVVFIQGPAGTSKSYVSIYAGLHLLQKRQMSGIMYIRSIIESASKSLGSLPGDSDLKMEPFLMPLQDKLAELLPKDDIVKLTSEGRIEGLPVNYLRGASINAKIIIADESQNFSRQELVTIITRLGQYSKLFVIGDPAQSDINGKSGFLKMFDLFNDDSCRANGIHCFSFGKEDVVRSGILKFILERLEIEDKSKVLNEPMFLEKK